MATRNSPEYARIAAAFINGARVPASSKTITGQRRLYEGEYVRNFGAYLEGHRALFSYGPHYPAILALNSKYRGQFLLNESRYYPSEDDRVDAGYQQSYYNQYHGIPRKRTPSTVTPRQLDAIKDELTKAGKVATDETVTIGDYTYRVWS